MKIDFPLDFGERLANFDSHNRSTFRGGNCNNLPFIPLSRKVDGIGIRRENKVNVAGYDVQIATLIEGTLENKVLTKDKSRSIASTKLDWRGLMRILTSESNHKEPPPNKVMINSWDNSPTNVLKQRNRNGITIIPNINHANRIIQYGVNTLVDSIHNVDRHVSIKNSIQSFLEIIDLKPNLQLIERILRDVEGFTQ
jgi:hypothetical protein